MKHSQSFGIGVAVAAMVLLSTVTPAALAQTAAPTNGGSGIIGVIVLLVLVVLAVGIAVSLRDRGRRREEKALELQARLSDALLLDPSLSGAAITPTVHAPFWPRGPLVIDIAGSVSSPELRDLALQLVRREAAGIAQELHIEDRILVNPRVARYVA